MVHALCLSQVGVSRREEMIKAPIIIEDVKHPSIEEGIDPLNDPLVFHRPLKSFKGSMEEGEVEKLNKNISLQAQTMQWLKWLNNTGEILLKIPHPCIQCSICDKTRQRGSKNVRAS